MVSSPRSRLDGITTPLELFDLLESLLAPLHDLHTSLSAPDLKRSSREFWRAAPESVMASGFRGLNAEGITRLFRPVKDAYPMMTLRSFCEGQLLYGHLDKRIGYLRILSFGGYSATGDNVGTLNGAFDTIFSDPDLSGLVIDLRVNLGGNDRLGLAVASRLAQHPYPAYRIERRLPGNRWEASNTAAVEPSAPPRFAGPVVALISPLTMSAGEIFALALMGRTPHVTTIGEDTQGLLGGIIGRHLPNGWLFALPNTRIVSPEGRSFEAKGLPPEIHIPAYGEARRSRNGDPALVMAIEVVRRQFQ
jgi:C-terminal processing protease CtpA/Prc